MAASELGDWHLGKCNITADSAELAIVALGDEETEVTQIAMLGLPAILALRDLIDEEVAAAEQRAELARGSNEGGGIDF